jgi:Domain of unknown function (DUF4148)
MSIQNRLSLRKLLREIWFRPNGLREKKTRELVRQELIEAERAGLVPSPRGDYPPSQATIARNQAQFRIVENYWASKQQPMRYSASN